MIPTDDRNAGYVAKLKLIFCLKGAMQFSRDVSNVLNIFVTSYTANVRQRVEVILLPHRLVAWATLFKTELSLHLVCKFQ